MGSSSNFGSANNRSSALDGEAWGNKNDSEEILKNCREFNKINLYSKIIEDILREKESEVLVG